jgi:predicted phage tail protein
MKVRQGEARKTIALVSWNDPDDNYKAKIEYVEDRDGLERYGYRERLKCVLLAPLPRGRRSALDDGFFLRTN